MQMGHGTLNLIFYLFSFGGWGVRIMCNDSIIIEKCCSILTGVEKKDEPKINFRKNYRNFVSLPIISEYFMFSPTSIQVE